jgi:catechol 2,3-dioxygenase-like lactoylglutathione lyase family enzyme
MQSAITHLFAGVPVSDLDASIDWYARFFGRPPDMRAGKEILWEVDEHATLFIEPNAARAGSPSPSLGSMRFSSASLPSALSTSRSRPTRTASAT